MRRVCLDMVHELARRDPRVVFVGSDLGSGTLEAMRQEMPHRFFMEGIAEQNLIGVAAGLALEGFIPYVNTIATFLTRRCYEQVAVDLCLHNLPVRLIANGGGLVYAPLGPTHTTQEDFAILRPLPNMTVVAPADGQEMRRFMEQTLEWPGPLYIRLAKGGDPVVSREEDPFRIGKVIPLRQGGDVVIIACGILVHPALAAAELLARDNISCTVLNCHTIKPLDNEGIRTAAQGARLLVSLEEHSLVGGLGSAVAEWLADSGTALPLLRLGLPDAFSHRYGSQEEQLAGLGLEPVAMAAAIRRRIP